MGARLGLRRRRERGSAVICPLCRQAARMVWRCRCGFFMCQACMDENAWGLSCNGITWTCPDCGQSNSYGNQ